MRTAPAAPLYRITPLAPDRRHPQSPIEVELAHVLPACQALRRAGVARVKLERCEPADMLAMLADGNLPALMRRQA